ncbi:two-component system sensor histidine kinase DcuS [Anaerobacillus alkalilacustris]|uniref:histidine kinase n=1 Tax=Anaerobacillus alkalilacustris TaxID=393763 RepID=A0A1S2LEY2_9BACI|nr:DcuS/MalK family sensor histidine kinase [Anaerobacillus alkalilacustris]OIJ10884.1 two-component system sensor histidine kinase DcuS [Anaerobacillus alkalilacustris]
MKFIKFKDFPLRIKIIFLVCSVIILALFVTNYLTSKSIESTTISNIEEKARDVSRTMALSPIVIGGLTGEMEDTVLQDHVEQVRKATDVLFIVVLDMDRIRKTHPLKEQIGKKFVGGDERLVFLGIENISIAEGTLGHSLRYFTPVFNDNEEQIGAVVAGLLLEDVEKAVSENRAILIIGTALSLLVGILGAIFLAEKVKAILFRMEPSQIAQLLEERSAMLHYAREGIVAIDLTGKITLMNSEGERLFKKISHHEGQFEGKKIEDIFPNSRMTNVLITGIAELDKEISYNGINLLANRVPIYVDKKIVGVVATFRDKTEFKKLAEELTRVKVYADALRAQTHEFMNKLHVILGMVHMKCYDELVEFVKNTTTKLQEDVGYITKHVKDPILAGFVLGKLSYARERGAELIFKKDCYVPIAKNTDDTHELITILGNLIDNSLDAVQGCHTKKIEVSAKYNDHFIYIRVSDTGVGISDNHLETIFQKGYSTKGEDRGMGLYLIQQCINRLNGTIDVISEEGIGTTIDIQIPYEAEE